jgi:hypothetical protein
MGGSPMLLLKCMGEPPMPQQSGRYKRVKAALAAGAIFAEFPSRPGGGYSIDNVAIRRRGRIFMNFRSEHL